jgi:hypothetical protein
VSVMLGRLDKYKTLPPESTREQVALEYYRL